MPVIFKISIHGGSYYMKHENRVQELHNLLFTQHISLFKYQRSASSRMHTPMDCLLSPEISTTQISSQCFWNFINTWTLREGGKTRWILFTQIFPCLEPSEQRSTRMAEEPTATSKTAVTRHACGRASRPSQTTERQHLPAIVTPPYQTH